MDEITKKNIHSYDATVEEYHKKTWNILEEPEIQQRNEFMSLLKKGTKILDLACGPGRDAKIFSERGFKVTGIDLSPKTIEKAKTAAPETEFGVMDLTDLKFGAGTFDAVFFSAGLLCIEKKLAPKVLKKINSILTKRGIFFVSVKEGAGEGFELDKRYDVEKYYAYYSEKEIQKLLADTNFEILKIYKLALKSAYHTHPWIFILCRKM